MNRLAIAVVLSLTPLLPAQQPKPRQLSATATVADTESKGDKEKAALLDRVRQAAARISTTSGYGSGILFKVDGKDDSRQFVLTCSHVAEKADLKKLTVEFRAGGGRGVYLKVAEVWRSSPETDACVLRLEKPVDIPGIRPLALAKEPPKLGHAFVAVGFPSQELPMNVLEGTFENSLSFADLGRWKHKPLRAGVADPRDTLLHTLAATGRVHAGYSGAALVNSAGEIAGVLTGRLEEKDKEFPLAVAVPELRRFVAKEKCVLDLGALPMVKAAANVSTSEKPVEVEPAPQPKPPASPKLLFTKTLTNGLPKRDYSEAFAKVSALPNANSAPAAKLFGPAVEAFLGDHRPPATYGLKVDSIFGSYSYSAPGVAHLKETYDASLQASGHELYSDGEKPPTGRLVSFPVARSNQSEAGLMQAFNGNLLYARRNVLRLHAPAFDGDFPPPGANATVALGGLHAPDGAWGETFFLDDFSQAWTYRHYTDVKQKKDWVVLYVLHGNRFTTAWFDAPSADLKTAKGRLTHANKAIALFSLTTSARNR